MKSKSIVVILKPKKESNTWKVVIRKLLLLSLNLSRSNKMRWMLLRRSLKPIWTRDLSLERLSTINSFKDIKTSRKKLKTNKISRESSLKEHSKDKLVKQDQVPLKEVSWVQPCKHLRWISQVLEEAKEQLVTQHLDHQAVWWTSSSEY